MPYDIEWLRPSGSTLTLQNTEELNRYALNAGFKRIDESIHNKNFSNWSKTQLIRYAEEEFSLTMKKSYSKTRMINRINELTGA